MPNENDKTFEYNPGEKSLKFPFIIYADLECLLEKINTCQNNQEKSYTEKKGKHVPSDYSLVTCCSYDKSEKDCMEMFCKDLKEQTMEIFKWYH